MSIEEKITTIAENTTKVFKSVGVKTANITAIDTDTKKATLTIGLSNDENVTYEDIDISTQLPSGNEIKDKLFWDKVMVETRQIENIDNLGNTYRPIFTEGLFINSEGWSPDNFLPYCKLQPKKAFGLFRQFRFKEADTAFDEGTQNNSHRNNSLKVLIDHAKEYYNDDSIDIDFSQCTDFKDLCSVSSTSSDNITADHQLCHLGLIDFSALSSNGGVNGQTFPAWLTSVTVKLPNNIQYYGKVNNFYFLEAIPVSSEGPGIFTSSAYWEELNFTEDSGPILGYSYVGANGTNARPFVWRMPSKVMKSYEGYYNILAHLDPCMNSEYAPTFVISNTEPSGKNYWWNIERFKEAFYYHLAKNWNTELGRERLGITGNTITREDAMNWFVANMQPDFSDNSTYITLPYASNIYDENNHHIGFDGPAGGGWTFKFVHSSNGASGSTGRCEPGWDIMTHNASFEADALDQIAFESGDRTEFEARLKAKDMTGFVPASAKMIAAGKDTSAPINEYIKGCQFVYWNEDGSIKDTPEPSMEGYGQNLDTNIY